MMWFSAAFGLMSGWTAVQLIPLFAGPAEVVFPAVQTDSMKFRIGSAFAMMLVFVNLHSRMGWSLELLFGGFFMTLLGVAAVVDLRHQIIPDSLNLCLLGVGLMRVLLGQQQSLTGALLGLAVGGGLTLILALLGPLGGGDIKLMAALGVWLGTATVVRVLIISFILAGLVCGLLMLAQKIKKDSFIPLGPFLVIGSMLVYVTGL